MALRESRKKQVRKERRALSVRGRVKRSGDMPRLCVTRSLKHISAQIIDDETGKTLAASTTVGKKGTAELSGKKKSEKAAAIGTALAQAAQEKGIDRVKFDRGPYQYHGRVKALADAAREAGLKF